MTTAHDLIFGEHEVVQDLKIEELHMGTKTRLAVELVRDGLGTPLNVPIIVARGKKPGPVFGLTAAVHGNELNGIRVIHRLMADLDPSTLRGAIVAVVAVNVPGVLLHQREFLDGTDLNHVMPGREDGNIAELYCHRFMQRIVRHFEFLTDLHTASFGRQNSLYVRADMNDPMSAKMAYLQRPQIIVHKPALDGTLRGAAMSMGIPAITTEIGNPQQFQPKYIRSSLAGLRNVLAEARVLPRKPGKLTATPVRCEHSYWIYTDIGGLLHVLPEVAETVTAGQQIAMLRNVYGDVVKEYFAPEDGVIIGKSVNPVGQSGARIVHLGIPSSDQSPIQSS